MMGELSWFRARAERERGRERERLRHIWPESDGISDDLVELLRVA